MGRLLLLNTSEAAESRAVLVEDGRVEDYMSERAAGVKLVGNVYKGRVVNREPGIGAAFVDVGVGRNGFLHETDWPARGAGKTFDECFAMGTEVVVQVTREIIGSKGPVLSGNISLPGRFLVLLPQAREGGVSRRIDDDEDRTKLRAVVRTLERQTGHGVILRTAAADRNEEELHRDLDRLERVWKDVVRRADESTAPARLFSESDLIARAVRDLVDTSVETIWVDTPEAMARAEESVRLVQPDLARRLALHEGPVPLFHAHGIETQIDRLRARRVSLPGGGSLVFDRTEALVAIDVNSGRMRDGDRLEETALMTNLEAAAEIARQVRLRDLGGVIVVDFIDMKQGDNVRAVERALKAALGRDRARVRPGGLGAFGLFAMTRRRASAGGVAGWRACPGCGGTGEIAQPGEVALRVFRELRARAAADGSEPLVARVGPEAADVLETIWRGELDALGDEAGRPVEIEADPSLPAGGWEIAGSGA